MIGLNMEFLRSLLASFVNEKPRVILINALYESVAPRGNEHPGSVRSRIHGSPAKHVLGPLA